MDKLNKLYEAVEMLEALGLPVSIDQQNAIDQMEARARANGGKTEESV